jgi:pilus assembly protein Flp/PilA
MSAAALRSFLEDQAGATAIEYTLIISLIFLAILGAVTLMASNTTTMWQTIATHV